MKALSVGGDSAFFQFAKYKNAEVLQFAKLFNAPENNG
jgi:hypothetical protein